MLLNKKPVDKPQGNASSNPVSTMGGYMSGAQEKGVAHSEKFKIFKFPGT
jgi:hypothetical protein